MAMGVNLQWGLAGLFNVGIVGFVALGGLATVLVSVPPAAGGFAAGGARLVLALLVGAGVVIAARLAWTRLPRGAARGAATLGTCLLGLWAFRALFDPAVSAIESVDPASTGYLGGLGLPVLLAWPVGGLFAAGAAWLIGKAALGLRSDYLAIATLGISEIVIALLKNEDWLARGVKNVVGLPRPVPYEIGLQRDPAFVERAAGLGLDAVTASTLFVKLCYAGLFAAVLLGAAGARPARAAQPVGPHDARDPRRRGGPRAPWARTSPRGTCRCSCWVPRCAASRARCSRRSTGSSPPAPTSRCASRS